MKRSILTLLAVAGAIAVVVIFSQHGADETDRPSEDQATEVATPQSADEPDAVDSSSNQTPDEPDTPPASDDSQATPEPVENPVEIAEVDRLVVLETPDKQPEPVIGNDAADPAENPWAMKVVLSPWGASVKSIHLSRYSHDPLEHDPYLIQTKLEYVAPNGAQSVRYPLAAQAVVVNDQTLPLANMRWTFDEAASDDSNKVFTILIGDAETKTPLLRIKRTYHLEPGYTNDDGKFVEGRYDLKLHQSFENLTNAALKVQFSQFGQADMPYAKNYLGDRRTVVTGYLQPEYDKSRTVVFIDGMQHSRKDMMAKPELSTLWPNDRSQEKAYELVFVAETNRYFATAVHSLSRTLKTESGETVERATPLDQTFPVVGRSLLGNGPNGFFLTTFTSKPVVIEGGESADLSLAFFAGPKAPDIIEDDPVYSALGLDELIIYNLGGCCSFLTFSWLADLLIGFLKLLHTVTFDWGVAIIILVLVVRGILHPITKKSQVNMMKFGKQMQALQPELDKLKKKYKDDQSKLNQEMMKLYREKGVNPAAMGLGCLPMFLQMPIWIALYAMLFFAIELRHQPAFYDVFHRISEAMGHNWRFLTDLSAPDNFIQFKEISILGFVKLSSVNLLPILMAIVFYIQQKFTTQPTTGTSDQAQQQQKIMKFMMLLFPIFLYKAPSGLTLYIMASTTAGIVDSYFVRKHLKQQEEDGTLFEKKQPKPGGFMDRMQKAAEAKRKQVEAQQRKMQGNQPRRKRR